MTTTVMS